MTRRVDTRWRRWAWRLGVLLFTLAAILAGVVILGSILYEFTR